MYFRLESQRKFIQTNDMKVVMNSDLIIEIKKESPAVLPCGFSFCPFYDDECDG